VNQLGIAVHEAGRGIQEVQEAGLSGAELKRRQDAERNLLVTA